MKRSIIVLLIITILGYMATASVFAENVTIGGKVDNQDIGSKIIFKDTATQQIVTEQTDPMGNYNAYTPQGTYDSSIVSPSGTEIAQKNNQKITKNSVTNYVSPSTAPGIPYTGNKTWLFIIGLTGIISLLIVGFYFFNAKKK